MRRVVLLAVSLLLLPSCLRAQGEGGSARVRGIVVTPEGRGLANSIVSLEPGGRELFAGDSGGFLIGGLAAGSYHLRVRHLGFAPRDTTIVVESTGPASPLVVRLERLTMRLTEVRVRGQKDCRDPGPPDPDTDPTLAVIFEQLRENADRWVLLAKQYPFTWQMERRFQFGEGPRAQSALPDTVVIRSDLAWGYAPGKVISEVMDHGMRTRQLNIPGLRDLADTVFLKSHCFTYGGLETVDDSDYVRLDFRAASAIRGPDIDGSAYLDPGTYQLRRARVTLTKPEEAGRNIEELSVTTWYGEIAPSIVILAATRAVTSFETTRGRIDRTETQKTVGVKFYGRVPPGVIR